MRRSYRVVIARPGPDDQDQGATGVARALRDAGFEVIDAGADQTPEQVAETALQEDADAVGLAVPSDAQVTVLPRVAELLLERDLGHVVVFGRGAVPDDRPTAAAVGARVFTPGTPLPAIAEWLEQTLDEREARLAS